MDMGLSYGPDWSDIDRHFKNRKVLGEFCKKTFPMRAILTAAKLQLDTEKVMMNNNINVWARLLIHDSAVDSCHFSKQIVISFANIVFI